MSSVIDGKLDLCTDIGLRDYQPAPQLALQTRGLSHGLGPSFHEFAWGPRNPPRNSKYTTWGILSPDRTISAILFATFIPRDE